VADARRHAVRPEWLSRHLGNIIFRSSVRSGFFGRALATTQTKILKQISWGWSCYFVTDTRRFSRQAE